MSVKIELSPNETSNTLFTRWKSLKTRGDKISLSHAVRKNVEDGIFSEDVLHEYKRLINEYKVNLANLNASITPHATEAHTVNRKESDELNAYLLQISNDYIKLGFTDKNLQDFCVIDGYINREDKNEINTESIKKFSNTFWIRLSRILGAELDGHKYWKQKYSYKLALETLKRNDSTVRLFLSRQIKDMQHLENIFLKIIKDNCKITLAQMQLEFKKRKEEEARRQEELKYQEEQDEIKAKFKRRLENLPPEKTCWFEGELL